MKKLCLKCQAIVRQNEKEKKRAYRLKLRIKAQESNTNKAISKGDTIEYDQMLHDLKKSAADKSVKKPIDKMFA